MSKQNQEYFKARQQHEQNVSKRSWILVVPTIVILLGCMYWVTNKSNEVGQQKTKEEFSKIGARISESNKTQGPTIITLENLGLSVELHEGLKYDYSTQVNMLTAISDDSTQLSYVIGEVPKSMQKPNKQELWIENVREKDPKMTFKDTMDYILVETVQNGESYKGILKFVELNGKLLVLNSVSTKKKFKDLEVKMNNVFESVKTK